MLMAMVVLFATVIFLAPEDAPLITRFAEVTSARGSGSSRTESSLDIPTAEDKPGIQLRKVFGLGWALVARVWVIRFTHWGHSTGRSEGLSWGRRRAFFLGACIVPDEKLCPMSR